MSRTVLAPVIVLFVVLAGCIGLNGPAGVDPTDASPTFGADDGDADKPAGTETDEGTETESPTVTGQLDEAVEGELEVHHIDVGLADATLIVTPEGETVLIDTGDQEDAGEHVIAYLEGLDIERIDHLVATHPHPEHIGGHAAVIEWAETSGDGIGTAYGSGLRDTSETYERYMDTVEAYDVELVAVEAGDEFPIEDDNVSALVLNPPGDDADDNLHYNSVSIVFEFGAFRYLTTGDAEAEAEERMVDEWAEELDADVYQAGHHAGISSSTTTFMEAVSPTIAVLSSNLGPPFDYPHDDILERFAVRGIETYWTGVHGDVVVTTDGSEISVETTEEFPTDPAAMIEEKPRDTGDEESNAVVSGPIHASAAFFSG